MIKTLSHRQQLGIIIDKPILDLLGIAQDTPLEITTDGDTLIICTRSLSRVGGSDDPTISRSRSRR